MGGRLAAIGLFCAATALGDPLGSVELSPRLVLQSGKPAWAKTDQSPGTESASYRLRDRDRTNLLRVLNLIAETEVGREVLKDFVPLYASGEVRIVQITPEKIAEASQVEGSRAVAVFEHTADGRKIIHVDFAIPMGALAPILFHEIIHLTDPEFLGSRERRDELRRRAPPGPPEFGSLRTRPRPGRLFPSLADVVADYRRLKEAYDEYRSFDEYRTYLTEVKAHKGMHRLIRQLERRFPGFLGFLERQEESGKFTFPLRSRRAILEGYGLSPLSVLRHGSPVTCRLLWDSLLPRRR